MRYEKFLMIVVFGLVIGVTNSGQAAKTAAYRYCNIRSEIRSWIPGKTLTTYQLHSSGTCSHGGEVGLGVGTGKKNINVNITCSRNPKQIYADVELSVIPHGKNKEKTETVTKKFEMPDLRPQRMELSKGSDGRIYELTLIPEIIEIEKPKTFNLSDLKLQEWDFRSSPVILNDQIYVGQMGVSGANLVGVDIVGHATCEFSLIPWKDSKPTGTLNDGVLNLKGKDISIMISGVHNGAQRQILEGGPYLVWTKWTEPKLSKVESQALVRQHIELLQKRREEGDLTITPEILRRMKEFAKSGKPMLMGSSGRDLRPSEIVDPTD